jgi:hypothetical protein
MRVSLRIKFFLVLVGFVAVMTIGISTTYYQLTKRDKQRESRQRIQIAFDILLNSVDERSRRAMAQMTEFLRTNAKIGNLLYLYQQEGGGASKRAIGVYLLNLVTELQQFAHIASPDRLLLYDTALFIGIKHG